MLTTSIALLFVQVTVINKPAVDLVGDRVSVREIRLFSDQVERLLYPYGATVIFEFVDVDDRQAWATTLGTLLQLELPEVSSDNLGDWVGANSEEARWIMESLPSHQARRDLIRLSDEGTAFASWSPILKQVFDRAFVAWFAAKQLLDIFIENNVPRFGDEPMFLNPSYRRWMSDSWSQSQLTPLERAHNRDRARLLNLELETDPAAQPGTSTESEPNGLPAAPSEAAPTQPAPDSPAPAATTA